MMNISKLIIQYLVQKELGLPIQLKSLDEKEFDEAVREGKIKRGKGGKFAKVASKEREAETLVPYSIAGKKPIKRKKEEHGVKLGQVAAVAGGTLAVGALAAASAMSAAKGASKVLKKIPKSSENLTKWVETLEKKIPENSWIREEGKDTKEVLHNVLSRLSGKEVNPDTVTAFAKTDLGPAIGSHKEVMDILKKTEQEHRRILGDKEYTEALKRTDAYFKKLNSVENTLYELLDSFGHLDIKSVPSVERSLVAGSISGGFNSQTNKIFFNPIIFA